MAENTGLQVSTSLGEIQGVWNDWLERADPEEREVVANLLGESDMETSRGIVKLAKSVIVEVVRGRLSPAIALAIRPWVDVALVEIDRQHAAAGSKGGAMDALAFMADLQKTLRPLRPVYQVVDKGEVLEAVVEVEQAGVKVAR